MKIISNFHDYYDSVMALGHDASVIYERRPTEIVTGGSVHGHDRIIEEHRWMNPVLPLISREFHLKSGGTLSCEAVSIFFCGKLHIGVRFTYTDGAYVTSKRDTFFSLDAVNTFLAKHQLEPDVIWKEKVRGYKGYQFGWYRQKQVYELGSYESEALLQRAIDTRTVAMVFVNHGRYFQQCTIIKDPRLADFDFYRVRDPFQAYQEIDMFMSGILAPENRPMVTIADKYKRDEHGFDEWSFKKLPTKKR